MISAEFATYVPVFIVASGIAIYFITKMLPRNLRRWSGALSALALMAAFGMLIFATYQQISHATTSYIGITMGLLITGVGAIAAGVSQGRLDPDGPVHLYYPLFLFALAGAVAVGFATDLFVIFVAVELSAIPVYALCAYRYREEPAALSSALRYLLLGGAGTLTALLGVAILYLTGHTLEITALPGALAGADPSIVLAAAILILVGYGVKLAIVPLHTWLPDAYARAPVGVTAILVGATKIGVLVALFLSLSALPSESPVLKTLGILVTLFAIITMVAGNLLALNQRDIRYVLSYSSVAQMGYIFLGFGIGLTYNLMLGFTAGLYYAIAYGIMKSGIFIAADAFAVKAGSTETAEMRGLGARNPLLGISFSLLIFGLIGVPFTSGFLGKLLLEQAGMVTSMFSGVLLALILALNSAISLGYYVPLLSTLMFRGTDAETTRSQGGKIPLVALGAVVFLAIVTVYLGLFPESFSWILHASHQLFPGGV